MSFLDELKKEAEEVKARHNRDNDTTQREQDQALQSVRPRMEALHRYLNDTCEQLNVVDPDVHMTYELRNYGKIGPLRQRGYSITVADPRNIDAFTVSFACSRPDQIKIQIDGNEAAQKQKEYMWSCNLRFTSKFTADGSGVFFIDAHVPVTFEFESDYDNARINLRIRNLESLGANRVSFEPRQITDELMEELAKMIVRKETRFQELSGNSVSEETRMRLRQQIAHDQYKRQIEANSTEANQGEQPVKKKRGLLSSLFKS
jgi:hypothetical protein